MKTKTTKSFLSKADLQRMYGCNYAALVTMLEEIKSEINWKEGQQRFTPNQVRRIKAHLGEPLTRDELLVK